MQMRWVLLLALALTESAFGESWVISDRVTGKHIPNVFWVRNKLPILDPTVSVQDPDGDGFLNEDEWRHGTDPLDKNSHPPFSTKLFLVERVGQTLRLKFTAYDGEPKGADLKGMTFQINAWAAKWRTMFIQVGERDEQTDLQIVSFQNKGANRLPSVTVMLAGEAMVLPLEKEVEGPEGAARLRDDLGAGTEFVAKTGQGFSLKAEPSLRYKLLGLSTAGAVIELPDGKRYVAPPLPEALKGK